MKRLALALAAIGLSSSTFAAFPGASFPTEVSIPQLPGGIVFGVSGYYLQPSTTNGDLDYSSNNQGITSPFYSNVGDVNPGYHWGWGANLGYIFPNTGNDINLSYFQLDSGFDGNISAAVLPNTSVVSLNPTILLPPLYLPFVVFNSGIGDIQYNDAQVDLTVGQYINVGCRLRLHPNAGLRYANIERNLNNTFSGPEILSSANFVTLATNEQSEFSGIGPLVGVDASYYLGLGFGAVAHLDSALLIGNTDDTLTANFSSTNPASILDPNPQNFNWDGNSNYHVVPAVDAKLGLDYTYILNNKNNTDLTVEVGWQTSKDYNAVKKVSGVLIPGETIALPQGIFITHTKDADFALSGPYASLIFHI